ncbi:MAG: hypothetical protein MUF49_27600 [Oculatellaceae cyanobacterium Prado106]|nr:hypothetical protein [Oculatellaceae cyanobacterium Prado106]
MNRSVVNFKSLAVSASLLLVVSLTGCSQATSANPKADATNPYARTTAASPTVAPSGRTAATAPATATVPQAKPHSVDQSQPSGSFAGTGGGTITESNVTTPQLTEGQYCYSASNDNFDATATLNVDAQEKVTGQARVVHHNEAAGYFSTAIKDLDGVVSGEQLILSIAIQIEGDQQQTHENWIVLPDGIETGRVTYKRVDCEAAHSEAQTPETSAGTSEAIAFTAGANAATVKGAVVRGTRNDYYFRANADQQMHISITSLEDNAVFDVIAPGSRIMQEGVTQWSGTLPADGEYDIVVSGTRGNATYEMTVQIGQI